MSEHGFPLQYPLTPDNWREALRQWSMSVPAKALGPRLVALLKTVTPQVPGMSSLQDDMFLWYQQPDDALRWRIFEKAKAIGLSTPTGALALSLFWSQGSMAPAGLDPVYPAPEISPQMLQSALVMFVIQLADTPVESMNRFFELWMSTEVR